MKNRSLWLFTACILTRLSAQALTIPQKYSGGKDSCALHREVRQNELEIWLKVPIDYKHPESGLTSLYAWTHKPFDTALPTVIFVSGGPGEVAHGSSLDIPGWNVVFFDQRGISCSKPDQKELYLKADFYSSENTARDIDEIRKVLDLAQISVYGVSYGTVPAHLYGHFFPDSARSVVLEGVIFEGGTKLMEPERRLKLLQRFFNSLPLNTQERILALSNHPQIAPNWFSNVGMMMLYLDNSLAAFKTFLENIIGSDESAIAVLQSFEKTNPEDQEFGFGHVMMGMVGCQELGMNINGVSFYSVFEGRKLTSDKMNHQQKHYCEALGFPANENRRLYQSTDYPTRTAMTYIQGTMDGATTAGNAVHHYKEVAKGFSQLILVENGGHAPLIGTLASGYESGLAVQKRIEILKTALMAEKVSEQQLEEARSATDLNWIYLSKNK